MGLAPLAHARLGLLRNPAFKPSVPGRKRNAAFKAGSSSTTQRLADSNDVLSPKFKRPESDLDINCFVCFLFLTFLSFQLFLNFLRPISFTKFKKKRCRPPEIVLLIISAHKSAGKKTEKFLWLSPGIGTIVPS